MSVQIRPGSKGRSIRQLASDLRTDAGLLVRQEIALAKAEVREKAGRRRAAHRAARASCERFGAAMTVTVRSSYCYRRR
ncbi:MAG TPA: phage holin family protein [Gemmatimonadales bacterium]|nr:phage holin family protein [Gemmatimonadales bacterium]